MLTGGYVVFGNLGSEAQLAGPVDRFQIRCYSLSDLNTPTTDANIIRLVQVDTDFPNDDVMGTDKTFTTSVYLRTNANTYGLVGWWKLDETSGLTAADGSGSGNNGTLVNGPSWTTGQIGGSLVFDGSDDYVNLGTGSSLNFGSSAPFTVAAWVKTTENYGMIVSFRSSTDGGPVIDLAVGKDDVDEDNGKAMILVRQNGGSGGYAKLKGNSSMNDGQWHHIVGVRGSGSTIELFLDGVSQGTDSGSQSGGAITTNLRAIGSERRWVSDGYGTADQRYLAGTIDDVRIYNRVLTAAEIAQLANTLQYKAFNEAKAASDSNTSVTISTPATSSGDLLITAVATDGDTSTTIAAPSGWTLINRGANGSVVTLGAWWKIAGSSPLQVLQ
ncbi:MAG: LamG domain-containing protein [Phycisphaerae bacterium]|nr:LamG domain-containing protein [Phycisphaerae bacterium]